ncbi:MAG: hypothetical protein ABI321_02475 [Polyangia bacterium]
MIANENERTKHIGTQLHSSNVFLSLGLLCFGVFLAFSGPLLNFEITIRRLPPVVTHVVGYIAMALGFLALVFLDKKQAKCVRCNKGFADGEAAFPEELDATTRPLVRAGTPAQLLDAPVGSRFGEGTHLTFNYCPSCKDVGVLSLHAKPGQKPELEMDNVLVLGVAAQQFANLCELHERVRDANNTGS